MGKLIDKAKGAVNDAIGDIKQHSDNPDTRAEGRAQEAKGHMQKAKGDVEGAMGNDV